MSEAASHPIGERAPSDVWARVATERALVTGALAVVGLHVVDDNFLQREPGISPADHLVSGLVPLALLVGTAIAFRRARPGLRATLALLAGFFGVLVGTEAAYYTHAVGPSGDDYTGLASIAAGLFLVGLGGVTLWRSRRRDDTLWWRYSRRLLIAAAVALAVVALLIPIAIGYVVTHASRAEVPRAALGAPHEDVAFTTGDELRLEGWFVPSRNGATVIVSPGRFGPQKQARMLVRHGYGVLLFDRRGEGASEGDPNAFGWHGDRDLHAAAAYLRGRPDVEPARIGAVGLSVGGEMLIRAAAHSDDFKAIVSEGASGQSVRDALANGDKPKHVVGYAANTLATAVFTNTLPPPSLKGEVEKIAPNAVFFVYGENGQAGTEAKPNQLFYAGAREPKRIWEVPGGRHIAGITTRPEEYERRVIEFFDEVLLGHESR